MAPPPRHGAAAPGRLDRVGRERRHALLCRAALEVWCALAGGEAATEAGAVPTAAVGAAIGLHAAHADDAESALAARSFEAAAAEPLLAEAAATTAVGAARAVRIRPGAAVVELAARLAAVVVLVRARARIVSVKRALPARALIDAIAEQPVVAGRSVAQWPAGAVSRRAGCNAACQAVAWIVVAALRIAAQIVHAKAADALPGTGAGIAVGGLLHEHERRARGHAVRRVARRSD